MGVNLPPPRPCQHCQRPVVWARTDGGHAIPLDPEPNSAGNTVARYEDGRLCVTVISRQHPNPDGIRFMPHFATCPILNKTRSGKPRPSTTSGDTQPSLF